VYAFANPHIASLLVTDRHMHTHQTHRQKKTQGHSIYRSVVASRGKMILFKAKLFLFKNLNGSGPASQKNPTKLGTTAVLSDFLRLLKEHCTGAVICGSVKTRIVLKQLNVTRCRRPFFSQERASSHAEYNSLPEIQVYTSFFCCRKPISRHDKKCWISAAAATYFCYITRRTLYGS